MKNINYGCHGLTAVISGGTSGIGLAAAEKLLLDGAQVFVLGRSRERGMQAVEYLKEQTGGEAVYISCDVGNAESCQKAAMDIKARLLGKALDILINSAGVYQEMRLENVTEEDYSYIMDINLKGTVFLTKSMHPLLRDNFEGSPCIVNIASDAGISGNYGCPIYCASKGAIVSLTKALALDMAPNVRVNCVCPADVDTPLLQNQLTPDCGYTKDDMAEAYPIGRIGKAEEIAHVVCSIASPANSFMTGSIVAVDGGLTAK